MAKDPAFCAKIDENDPEQSLIDMGQGDSLAASAFNKIRELVEYRLGDGYDCACGTLKEEPALLLSAFGIAIRKAQSGKVRLTPHHGLTFFACCCQLKLSTIQPDEARERGFAAATALRAKVQPKNVKEFDELLDDARYVASIRDERALYMDLTAMGIIHHILLESGRRLVARPGCAEKVCLFSPCSSAVIIGFTQGINVAKKFWYVDTTNAGRVAAFGSVKRRNPSGTVR